MKKDLAQNIKKEIKNLVDFNEENSHTPIKLDDIAHTIALIGHDGQFRRDGTTPYYAHVWDVACKVEDRGGDEDDFIVAAMHDLLEDTDLTRDILFDLINPYMKDENRLNNILDAVDALTKKPGEAYNDAVMRAKAHPIARKVKIADNLANLSDSPTDKQILKYAKSLQILMED